jgi:hypothetical protein
MKTEEIQKPTPADFRRPDVITAALTVLRCRAFAATMRTAVDKIGQALLETTHPLTDDDGERITSTRWAWRAYSGEGWAAWRAACVSQEHKTGLRVHGWNDELCPALVAEEETRQAERALIDLSGERFGVTHGKLMSHADGMANREKWLELTLNLALSSKGDVR